MTDDELMALARDAEHLSPEAEVALQFELEKRNLDVGVQPAMHVPPPYPTMPWRWQAFPKRIGRLEYFTWQILIQATVFVAAIVASVILESFRTNELIQIATALVFILLFVADLIVEFIIVTPRRCHDLGYGPGTELLLLVPLANIVIGLSLLLKEGSPGPNAYGPKTPTRTAFGVIFGLLSGRHHADSTISGAALQSQVSCKSCGTVGPYGQAYCRVCGTSLGSGTVAATSGI